MIISNGLQPLTIITKHSVLDVAAALDPPLSIGGKLSDIYFIPDTANDLSVLYGKMHSLLSFIAFST